MRIETTPKSKIFARTLAPYSSKSGRRTISGATGYCINSELASRRSCSGARVTPAPRTVCSKAKIDGIRDIVDEERAKRGLADCR